MSMRQMVRCGQSALVKMAAVWSIPGEGRFWIGRDTTRLSVAVNEKQFVPFPDRGVKRRLATEGPVVRGPCLATISRASERTASAGRWLGEWRTHPNVCQI